MIRCPECKHEHEEPSGELAPNACTPRVAWEMREDIGEIECEACGFSFTVEIDYSPTYSTRCKECENKRHLLVSGAALDECVRCGAVVRVPAGEVEDK